MLKLYSKKYFSKRQLYCFVVLLYSFPIAAMRDLYPETTQFFFSYSSGHRKSEMGLTG